MAEAFLSEVAFGILLKVDSLLPDEIVQQWGVDDELDKLRRTVSRIDVVLLDAEKKSSHSYQVEHWLEKLSEAMYDAEDLLDEISTEALRRQVMGGSNISKKVRLFFSSSNPLAFSLKMAYKVKALRKRFDAIADLDRELHLEENAVERRMPRRDQSHRFPPQQIIGRDGDRDEIVQLLQSDSVDNVSVVSIVGFGGLGKTALAQLIYNDDWVKNHFELKMWVCVSENFDVQLLVRKTLESAIGENVSIAMMDQLRDHLHEKIKGRKFLLVLDDVWNEDQNKWCSFMDLLAGGARGSKIVITTRSRRVAEMSRSFFIHELRGLTEYDSWLLLKQVAIKPGQLLNPSFEAMGREIVNRCFGTPIAIKAMGGALNFKDSDSEWLLFKDKVLSTVDVYKYNILPILKLSYDHLPSHYKHCFAYCCLYPKDFKIPVNELIQLWKAQGYIKSTNSSVCLQDAGLQCFMDLSRLSFFEGLEYDEFDNITYCKMHDLMHDLATSIAGDNFSGSLYGMPYFKSNVKHLSFEGCSNYFSQCASSLSNAKATRTILALDSDLLYLSPEQKELEAIFCSLKCLRVLDLSHMQITTLPDSIYRLKHLRYLDLSHNDGNDRTCSMKLPNSITKLQNLEVLKVAGCPNLVQLPIKISKLVNLIDLDNYNCNGLTHMPRGIGKLSRLETLPEFVISKDHSISKDIGGLDELHSLNNLRGELHIKNLGYVKNVGSEFVKARLNMKDKLQKLKLNWGLNEDEKNNDEADDEMGMEALCPHPNLKQLTVLYYRSAKPPSWLPSITGLMSVSFLFCRSIQRLPPLDQLIHLKSLNISGLTKLESILVENKGGSSPFFPCLTDLTLAGCPNLKGFERPSSSPNEEIPSFPCLSQMEISGCPNLTYLPLFPELNKLKLDGCGMKSLKEILKTRADSASESTSSPLSPLYVLEDLHISNMEDSLDHELLQCLPSLRSLSFWCCSLRFVCSGEEEDGTQWQSLEVLRRVEFWHMDNMVSLPKGLQYVSTLQRVLINDCPCLERMPEWMPKLTALRDLTIKGCSQLEERCKNNSAEHWPLISHIPNISIGGQPIQRNGCYLL